ncbi:polyketide cyclase [Streptomyces lunaelactis]|uniref:Polyketide cyclase n=1 Tax=Streptomyces lunaelactis TaxID=1535768 RepID=A0A2R4SX91_9ACTN|nr:SRPBCC family protein [Streptomyces lunaelactis]AVZ71488.1 polyketide cyclase [Streptomyces lunaelactis]NUK00878.1 SRPBCC family protein [Streptomyces lunaelactis]NUK07410.1 SRPBCC family protein [Streptomyces lunaelactis]NUK14765.1 SRPBCC family protein [Streptomyces lunaelactis]NUK22146.1 SRPBCC family protein [Streptomyces lunaelactis]
MSDIVDRVNDVRREVGNDQSPAGERHTVLLRRLYAAEIEDVWDACTTPERLSRWFLPVTGDLRPGGTYQLEGNARGEILRCQPPGLLKASWVYGEGDETEFSEVELRLSQQDAGQTVFELVHLVAADPRKWGEYGPGAVGVGWDLTLLSLHWHLSGKDIQDPRAWQDSPEARTFMTHSSRAWGAAHEASGVPAAEAAAAAENTAKAYVPEP